MLAKNPEAEGAMDGLTHQTGDDVMLGVGRGDRRTEPGRDPMEDQHMAIAMAFLLPHGKRRPGSELRVSSSTKRSN